ncbi:thiamine phosphate synthase [Crenobacter cavernae]|uniref:Thiamine-phosphate synthase n=1 Tax=Crenobacter cavernae TaxID=2290923 RepID=A0ABY0FCP3_9NEIS|nr:thiamine phosphate synthase [Crenobacter cavernae]RXZ43894.1 thiamine phosphate synthase [Crenobacter cavernae]
MTKNFRGLYAITPDTADTDGLLAKTRAILEGGAAIVQYRNKSRDAALRRTQAEGLLALCREAGALLLINDDVELAREIGADGVHVGRDDAGIADARRILGADAIVGVSCYDQITLAETAVAAGASYVAFGAVFASSVKPEAIRAPLTLFHEAKRLKVPSVAIGGIGPANARQVVDAGADAISLISALYDAADPEAVARELSALYR